MSKRKNTILVVGNWKMNPSTLGLARKLFIDIRKGIKKMGRGVKIVIAPPFPFISELSNLSPSRSIAIASQDVFFERSGAYTGEVSMSMLKSVGVTHVIVGHSERRARGENNEEVYMDTQAVLKHGAKAIICIGERRRDIEGHYLSIVERQLRIALKDVKSLKLKNVIIAYEPIWAIGTGKTATPEDVHEMKLFIQKILTDLYSRKVAMKLPILYGGSVNKANATELLEEGEVDGFLVGGASIIAKEFIAIASGADEFSRKK